MNGRRALLLVATIAAVLMTWAAARYASRFAEPATRPAQAAEAREGAEPVTLHFFRNPAAAPAFVARDLDGHELTPASLRGKVVIVNFWATWCPPCRAEIPDLVALQEKYRDHLQVIGISEDEISPELVRKFANDHKVNYPIVMMTPELEKMFPGISALPTSFIIDKESRVVQKHVGMLSARTTEYETRSLAGLPVDAAVEHVDQTQGLKLENGAQLTTIPGIDLAALSPAKRTEALQALNSQPCTCGCDLTLAKCRVDDPGCGVSLPLARDVVKQIAGTR
ncbi:MAG TPA: TlpA disulfide reductase family protein [Thermoanaerobaculia bacterium]|nr:TlpA disulfide reductase family protein [Thermoanaerobaculia bacterium]